MSVTAFAAETRQEYRSEAAPIQQELKTLNEEMKSLREENQAASALYKEISAAQRETGELTVDTEIWEEAKALRVQIRELQAARRDSTGKETRAQAREAAANGDFDTALQSLSNALEEKEARCGSLKEIHELWQKIASLLSAA